MTREEASYILRKFYADGYKSNNYNTLEQALKIAVICIENLPHWISVEFPHWISVKEELPKKDGKYLIYTKSGQQIIANYECHRGKWHQFNEAFFTPTHWIPLPQPPKEGGEE